MVDGCISLAKFDPVVAKKSLKTSAISAAEEIGPLFTLISEIFRTLPYLRELRSSISFHVFRGFILFTSKLCVKYWHCLLRFELAYIAPKPSRYFLE